MSSIRRYALRRSRQPGTFHELRVRRAMQRPPRRRLRMALALGVTMGGTAALGGGDDAWAGSLEIHAASTRSKRGGPLDPSGRPRDGVLRVTDYAYTWNSPWHSDLNFEMGGRGGAFLLSNRAKPPKSVTFLGKYGRLELQDEGRHELGHLDMGTNNALEMIVDKNRGQTIHANSATGNRTLLVLQPRDGVASVPRPGEIFELGTGAFAADQQGGVGIKTVQWHAGVDDAVREYTPVLVSYQSPENERKLGVTTTVRAAPTFHYIYKEKAGQPGLDPRPPMQSLDVAQHPPHILFEEVIGANDLPKGRYVVTPPTRPGGDAAPEPVLVVHVPRSTGFNDDKTGPVLVHDAEDASADTSVFEGETIEGGGTEPVRVEEGGGVAVNPAVDGPMAGRPAATGPMAVDPPAAGPAPAAAPADHPAQADTEAKGPRATRQETADPKASDPQESNPKGSIPQGSNPETTNPQTTDPRAADPRAADPQAADPQAADPKTANPKTSDPKTSDPKTSDPEADADPHSIAEAGATAAAIVEDVPLPIQAEASFEETPPAPKLADFLTTPNQKSTAAAVDALPASHPVRQAALDLLAMDPSALASFTNTVSGELHPTVEAGMRASIDTQRELPLARLRASVHGRPEPGAYTADAGLGDAEPLADVLPSTAKRPVWAQIVGNWQNLGGRAHSAKGRQNSAGVFMGADAAVGDGWRMGGALGYMDSRLSVPSLRSSATMASYSAIVYGGKAIPAGPGAIHLALGGAYTWHDVRTRRRVSGGGLDQQLRGDYAANTVQLFSELGYDTPVTPELTVQPYAGLSYSDYRRRAFTERGGSAALSGRRQRGDTTTATVGVRGAQALKLGRHEALATGALAWRRNAGNLRTRASLSFDAGDSFTVTGAPVARDSVLVETGFQVRVGKSTAVRVDYAGQFGGGARDHTASVNLTWRF
ncbi:autotransporter outer membrane beta-barrel domain-containing protein [Achromobacter aloeverae]|uniref:Autotransporter domain-containing protein n=1 Tax=Achromobacter aloeverae TaxID=1750518 RepID=A0A4Q1HG98_9BURK|nr:autotransporter outer membrane beta-barrel domain-containing protein [Achromobacter aloeverae]RXN86195.1 hypothetical protein C7R54_20935 [Achromobacter aloeverae]